MGGGGEGSDGSSGLRTLVLALIWEGAGRVQGHPAGEASSWNVLAPWKGTRERGRLGGKGATWPDGHLKICTLTSGWKGSWQVRRPGRDPRSRLGEEWGGLG